MQICVIHLKSMKKYNNHEAKKKKKKYFNKTKKLRGITVESRC